METVREGVAPMAVVSYEFRTVRRLEAEAIGVPGKRTFRGLPEVPAPAPLIRLSLSFHADRFELGHDAETGEFMLYAHDWEVDETAPHTFACRTARTQMEALAANIEAVCAAGRPRCDVCGLPINGPNHVHGDV